MSLGVLLSIAWINPASGQPSTIRRPKSTHSAAQVKPHNAVPTTKTRKNNQAIPAKQTGSVAANPMPEQSMAGVRALYATAVQMEAQARALYKSGDLVNAERVSQQAVSAAPIEGGTKRVFPSLLLLQGEIYLAMGRNQKALQCLLAASQNTSGALLDLDLALAYFRLGEYDASRQFYLKHDLSEQEFQGQPLDAQDLPASDAPARLEAYILVARALEYNSDYRSQALADYAAAERIIPDNPLLSYNYGCELMQAGRYVEAMQRLQVAASQGHGLLAGQGKREAERARNKVNYYAQHPDQAPSGGR